MKKNEGKIYRKGGVVFVEITNLTLVDGEKLLEQPGVICVNPRAAASKRIYQKQFTRKKVYLPNEYDKAVATHLKGNDVITLGMNGYSALSDQKCLEYGVKPGAYEAACAAILRKVIHRLEKEFPGVDVRLVHGASDLGVDRVIIDVATELNITQLGHSCPKFMFYVIDDDVPVYVAKTQAEYAESFIRSLDILIAANGRKQAFEHDIHAAFNLRKHLIPVNVLKGVSTTGGPPAENADGGVEDAVALLEQLVHMVSQTWNPYPQDPFAEMAQRVEDTTVSISRRILSPARAYGK